MNTLFQKTAKGLALALSLSLTSCERDSLLTPNPAGVARSESTRTDDASLPSPNIPQVYKLTKYGATTLLYSANGRLLSATTPVRGGVSIQTDYTYGPGSVRAFSHQGKVVLHDETFTLDASGRCTESVEKGTFSDTHWMYHYTPKGQLWSCQNKNSCVGGTTYTYNADGDMILASVATGVSDAIDITFAYNEPTGDPLLADKYPLNVNVGKIPQHDTYLRIFGKPGKHLIKLVSFEPSADIAYPSPSDVYYSYVLNAEGYVTKKVEYNLSTLASKTTLYDYIVTNIGLQF